MGAIPGQRFRGKCRLWLRIRLMLYLVTKNYGSEGDSNSTGAIPSSRFAAEERDSGSISDSTDTIPGSCSAGRIGRLRLDGCHTWFQICYINEKVQARYV